MEDVEYLNVAYFGRKNNRDMTLQDMVEEFPELDDVKDAIKSLTGLSFQDYYTQSGYPRKAVPELWAQLFNEWFNAIRRSGILTDKDLTDLLGAAFDWDKMNSKRC